MSTPNSDNEGLMFERFLKPRTPESDKYMDAVDAFFIGTDYSVKASRTIIDETWNMVCFEGFDVELPPVNENTDINPNDPLEHLLRQWAESIRYFKIDLKRIADKIQAGDESEAMRVAFHTFAGKHDSLVKARRELLLAIENNGD